MEQTPELPRSVVLATGPHGLPRLEVTTPLAEAHLYFHGAHVAHYAAAGQEPLLFLSAKSYFQAGKPIRGGVPVIFPWFGAKVDDPAAPAHGFARLRTWIAESVVEREDGSVVVTFRLDPDEESRRFWPGEWVLRHRITVGSRLVMELEIENRGSQPLRCEEALHTYFRVGDIGKVEVLGLDGVEYASKIETPARNRQSGPICFIAETDRAYFNTGGGYAIVDPEMKRRIVIEKSGSRSAVVWNPWVAKSRAMPDFGDDEWPGMLCVETANIAENALEIPPGGRHISRTETWAENL